jgi:hypothetical protein
MYLSQAGGIRFYSHCYSISCWHQNKKESDAMWALYARREAGIALKSSVGRLLETFAESPLARISHTDE